MATTKTLLETAMLKLGGVGTMPSTNADYISVSTTSPTSGYESYIAPTDGWLCLLTSKPSVAYTKVRLTSRAGTDDNMVGATTVMPADAGVTSLAIPARKGAKLLYYIGCAMGVANIRFLKSMGGAL